MRFIQKLRKIILQNNVKIKKFWREQVEIGAGSFNSIKFLATPIKDAKEIIIVLLFLAFLGPIALELFFNASAVGVNETQQWPSTLVTLWNNLPSIAFVGIVVYFLDKTS